MNIWGERTDTAGVRETEEISFNKEEKSRTHETQMNRSSNFVVVVRAEVLLLICRLSLIRTYEMLEIKSKRYNESKTIMRFTMECHSEREKKLK